MTAKDRSTWNSLVVAKLAASSLTPLPLFWFAQIANKSIRTAEIACKEAEAQALQAQQSLEQQRRLAQTRQAAVQVSDSLVDTRDIGKSRP